MRVLTVLLVLLPCLPLNRPAAARHTVDPPIRVVRIDQPPRIDGVLDEAVWAGATRVVDFRQRQPEEGAPPREPTEVLLVYTPRALYVGLRAHHAAPDAIAATTLRRDHIEQLMQDDQFALAIDTYNDGRNGYWFSTNPLGVRVDGQFFDEGTRWEMAWDGLWTCRTLRTAEGWSAEWEIPFSTLRFGGGPEITMGLNFFRRVIQTNEQLFAPLIPLRYPSGTATVSLARKFVFEGIQGGRSLLIKPYALGGLRNDETHASGRFDRASDAGLDVRYGISDNLTATLSLNTDFAEAEVDERRINLTRFSLFLPEQRDFFLENSGSFVFGIPQETELFFSRRIGLAPDGAGTLTAVPLLAGAKVTGTMGPVEMGLLSVRTRRTDALAATQYGVARAKISVRPRSYVGGLFTGTWSDPAGRQTYGADFTLHLTDAVGLAGFVARTSGRDHRSGSALHLALFRATDRTAFHLAVTDLAAAFDPALGFVLRPGTRKWEVQGSRPWYPAATSVRRVTPEVKAVHYAGPDGRRQSAFVGARVQVAWRSEDQVTVFTTRTFEHPSSGFRIFRDVVVPTGRYTDQAGGLEAATKPGRPLAASMRLTVGSLYGGRHIGGQLSGLWKVSRHLAVVPYYSLNVLHLPAGSVRAYVLRSRVNVTLNTRLAASGLLQYDNASDLLGLNIRLNYLFREGTELILVFNESLASPRLGMPVDLGVPRRRAVLVKLTYLLGR